jgi:hypothetical protein
MRRYINIIKKEEGKEFIRKNFLVFLFSILFFSISSSSLAQQGFWEQVSKEKPYEKVKSHLVEKLPNGLIIDWEKKIVIVRGKAKITGPKNFRNKIRIEKEAEKDAIGKLLKLIGEIRITKNLRLKDIVKSNKEIGFKIKNYIENYFQVIDRRVENGNLVVTIVFSLKGKNGLFSIVQEELIKFSKKETKEKIVKIPEKIKITEKYTGLIIDAKDLGVKPGISPKIYSETGKEVYGTLQLSSDLVVEKGIVSYANSVEEAKNMERAGNNPLIIKALKKGEGEIGTDVVISEEDALKILKANEVSRFLEELKVVIVI